MTEKNKKKSKIKNYLLLHLILLLYSFGAICSKLAAGHEFLSLYFCVFYGLVLLDLVVYAVLWQQILKKIPLNIAYANKSITLIWGMLWGVIIFHETLSWNNIIGAVIVLVGVIIMVSGGEERVEE